MTAISTIISDAYRETNLIARGASPNTSEEQEGLRLLNRFIQSLFGNEVGDNLEEALIGNNSNIDTSTYNNEFELFVDNNFLPPGYRLKLNLDEAKTIKLDPRPEDGDMFGVVDASNNLATYNLTLDGNGSRIEGNTDLTLNISGYSATWFYRADKANWQRVTNLTATDESPFPEAFDDLLIIGLAMRLNPRNGPPLSEMSLTRYANVLRKFKARYSLVQARRPDLALLLTSGQRGFGRGYSLTGEFERGSIFLF
jgi:hypothetical protein